MENENRWQGIRVEKETITHIRIPLFQKKWAASARATLELHGCTLEEKEDHYFVTFPAETTRIEQWPRAMCIRYLIRLPDGYELLEQECPRTKFHSLGFSPEDLHEVRNSSVAQPDKI